MLAQTMPEESRLACYLIPFNQTRNLRINFLLFLFFHSITIPKHFIECWSNINQISYFARI